MTLFKTYDDIIKSMADGSRLAVSCGQDNMVDTTQGTRSKLPALKLVLGTRNFIVH
jgi:hypothetical protein